MKETISILGCGWYGLALAKKLIANGYSVKGSTTSIEKLPLLEQLQIKPYLINFDLQDSQYESSFFESEVLIVAIPPKRHSGEFNSYPNKIRAITEAAINSGSIQKILMISSTSVYSDLNREIVVGEIPYPDTESGSAILEAEQIITKLQSISNTIIRFGGLIGPGRNLAKFFAGKKNIANGLAPVNLIHLDDCIALTLHILENGRFGYTLNACSPDHPTRMELYTQAALISDLEPPEFLPELLTWKVINGNGVSLQLNYKYLVNKWSEFLTSDKL